MILFRDSFDYYATAQITQVWTQLNSGTIEAGEGRCGTKAFRRVSAVSAESIAIGVTNADEVGGYAQAVELANFSAAASNGFIQDADGENLLFVRYPADGSIQVWIGANLASGTQLLASAAGLLSAGIYAGVGIEWRFHATLGYIKIYVNGVLQAQSLNINTTTFPPSGGYTPTLPWRRIGFSPAGDMDDIVIFNGDNSDGAGNTTIPGVGGDPHVEALVAVSDSIAAGFHAQWTPLTGTNHGAMVDENPPDGDTSYNASGTVGLRDTYRYPSLVNLTVGTLHEVTLMLNARKTDDISVRSLKPTFRIGAADFDGTAQAVSTAYRYYWQGYGVHPVSGVKWTVAQANGIDGGILDAA